MRIAKLESQITSTNKQSASSLKPIKSKDEEKGEESFSAVLLTAMSKEKE